MARTAVEYRCAACGYQSPKWLGRCPDCGSWGSVSEESVANSRGSNVTEPLSTPMPLVDVDPSATPRHATGVSEFDRVLGNGLVAGSVTLIGGEPGMGKSTLVLQVL